MPTSPKYLTCFAAGCLAAIIGSPIPSAAAAEPASIFDQLDPAAIPAKERFDWQPRELVAVLGTHRGAAWGYIRRLAYSPDGRWIAGAGTGPIMIWDSQTLQPVAMLSEHRREIERIAFSPDGCWLAAAGNDRVLRLWDCRRSPPELMRTIEADEEGLTALAFSPDSRRLAFGNAAVEIWTIEDDGKATLDFIIDGLHEPPGTIAFSPDGKSLAIAMKIILEENARSVRIYDLSNREPVLVKSFGDSVYELAYSPDGKRLVTGDFSANIQLWTLDDAPIKEPTFLGHHWRGNLGGLVRSVAFSPDGKTVIGSGGDANIKAWDVSRPEPRELAAWDIEECQGRDNSIVFSPDGKTIASGGDDGAIYLWDIHDGKPKLRPIAGQSNQCRADPVAIIISHDDRFAAVRYPHRGIQVIDLTQRPPAMIAEIPVDFYDTTHLAFIPDGSGMLVVSNEDKKLGVWDIASRSYRTLRKTDHDYFTTLNYCLPLLSGDLVTSGERSMTYWRVQEDKFAKHREVAVESFDFFRWLSHDGKLAADFENMNVLKVFDVAGERLLLLGEHRIDDAEIDRVDFSRNGDKLAFIANRPWDPSLSELQILSSRENKLVATLKPTDKSAFTRAKFTPDGMRVVSCDDNGKVVYWNIERREPEHSWQFPGVINDFAFSADGRYLLTANANGTTYVLKLPNQLLKGEQR